MPSVAPAVPLITRFWRLRLLWLSLSPLLAPWCFVAVAFQAGVPLGIRHPSTAISNNKSGSNRSHDFQPRRGCCWHPRNNNQNNHERMAPVLFGSTATTTTTGAATAEIVGASGRMGTFYFEHYKEEGRSAAAACPRGSVPGRLSREGSPIYVATPSDIYAKIYDRTLPERRRDLVLIGNPGLPIDDRFEDCTILVPHFAVLRNDQWRSSGSENQEDACDNAGDAQAVRVDTDPEVSPPTYIYGTHAGVVSDLLEAHGIVTQEVGSFRQIRAIAARKLVWASCFWLLCHTAESGRSSNPLTVGEVLTVRRDDLERLVDELLPPLREWLDLPSAFGASHFFNKNENESSLAVESMVERSNVLQYLEAYSKSIPGAIPSFELSVQEFSDRNGVWLSPPPTKTETTTKEWQEQREQLHKQQPFHVELLGKVGIDVRVSLLANTYATV